MGFGLGGALYNGNLAQADTGRRVKRANFGRSFVARINSTIHHTREAESAVCICSSLHTYEKPILKQWINGIMEFLTVQRDFPWLVQLAAQIIFHSWQMCNFLRLREMQKASADPAPFIRAVLSVTFGLCILIEPRMSSWQVYKECLIASPGWIQWKILWKDLAEQLPLSPPLFLRAPCMHPKKTVLRIGGGEVSCSERGNWAHIASSLFQLRRA